MFKLTTIAYARRQNANGTTDSICRHCFITVITASWEGELSRAEHDHTCDPMVLDYWSKMKEDDERPQFQQYDNYDYE